MKIVKRYHSLERGFIMIVGAQLYTLRAYTQTEVDLARTLERVAKIGYKTVQISAIGKDIKPEKVKKICDDLGLSIVLTHSPYERIINDTERLIEEHTIMGCDYIGLGAMPDKYRSAVWFDYFVEDMKPAVEKIAKAGKLCMYHNHNFEFEKVGKNRRLIDALEEEFTKEELGFTLDTYWIQAAGADVCDVLLRFKERIPCVHLKDMTVKGMETIMAPVMEGNLNFPAIFETLNQTNAKYLLVEQDVCQTDPFECLTQSYNNLKQHGFQ